MARTIPFLRMLRRRTPPDVLANVYGSDHKFVFGACLRVTPPYSKDATLLYRSSGADDVVLSRLH